MSAFTVTAPNGRTLKIEGDTAPSEAELDEIFAKVEAPAPAVAPRMSAAEDALQRLKRSSLTTFGQGLQGVANTGETIDRRIMRLIHPRREVLELPSVDAQGNLIPASHTETDEEYAQRLLSLQQADRGLTARGLEKAGRYMEELAQAEPVDPTRNETPLAKGAEFGGGLLGIVSTGGAAPLFGGIVMGEDARRRAIARGLPATEVERSALVNTAGGTALNALPVLGAGRVGTEIDRRVANEFLRRGARAGAVTALGAGTNALGDIGLQLADTGKIDWDRVAQNASMGGGVGLLASGVGRGRDVPFGYEPPPPARRTPAIELDVPAPRTEVVTPVPVIETAELAGPPTPAQVSAQAIENAIAREEALRQSPEGAQLLAQQLDEEAALARNQQAQRNRAILDVARAEEAAIPPPVEPVASPAESSAQVFEEAAAQEGALRQSPEGARLLAEQLQAEADLVGQERLLENAAQQQRAAEEAAIARRIGANEFGAQREQLALDRQLIEQQDALNRAAVARRAEVDQFARMRSQRGGVNPELVLDPRIRAIGGGLGGAAYGLTQGDTPEERLANAMLYGGGGMALGVSPELVGVARRGLRSLRGERAPLEVDVPRTSSLELENAPRPRIEPEGNQPQHSGADFERTSTEAGRSDSLPEGGQVAPEAQAVAEAGAEPPVITDRPQADINFKLEREPSAAAELWSDAKNFAKQAGRGIDKYAGIVSTRLKNIAPEVWGALQRYEYNTRNIANQYKAEVLPFIEQANKLLNADDQRRLTAFLNNGDFDAVGRLIEDRGRANPELAASTLEAFNKANSVFKDIITSVKDAGIDTGELENYWHRQLDPRYKEEFLEKFGKEESGPIWEAVKQRAESLGIDPENISISDRADITNQVLRGVNLASDGGLPTQFRKRGITDTTNLEKYYLPYDKSAIQYIDKTVRYIERKKLFGNKVDNTGSLGRAVEQARQRRGLSAQDEADIVDIFKARFGPGEQGSSKIVQKVRNATNIAYLGQFLDSVTQLADYAISLARYGPGDTIGALVKPNEITAKSLGIEQLGQDLTHAGRTVKAVDGILSTTGFKKIVEAAQNNSLNASLRRMRRLANSEMGLRQLADKYQAAFGADWPALVDDLQNNRITDNTKLAAFSELTDSQPITLSEVPQAYLENPNGRLLYALKTYTLKQYDLYRRDAYNTIKQGAADYRAGRKADGLAQMREGVTNLAKLGAAYSLGAAATNAIKDAVLDRDIDPDDYTATALLNVAGLNRFDLYNLAEKGPYRALTDKILPPLTFADEAAQALTGKSDKLKQRLPWVGDLWFAYTEGGQKRKEAERKRRANATDPEAILRREKAAIAKEKRGK